MKGRKNSARVSQHKILGSQAQKLKDKLQHLKEQIRVKKQQKQMNKTVTSGAPFNNNYKQKHNQDSRMSTTQYTRKQDKQETQIIEALSELKIQNIGAKLKQKNIQKVQQLLILNEEDIDKWKDIPIGYRIKLKKYIQKNKNKSRISELKVIQVKPQSNKVNLQIRDIQSIIQNRKAQQVYVPIDRKMEQQYEEYKKVQLQEEEQQEMMMSIFQVLGKKDRKSNLKHIRQQEEETRHVHWSSLVDQMELKHTNIKIYPKQKIQKSIFHESQQLGNKNGKQLQQEPLSQQTEKQVKESAVNSKQLPNYKYCWICLKKLQNQLFTHEQRDFCSQQCYEAYQLSINPAQLLCQFVKTQEEYNKFQQFKNQQAPHQQTQVSFDIL